MSKLKILTFLVIVLVVLNVSVICFFLVSRAHHSSEMQEGPRRIIIEKLHLDAMQQEKYAKLIIVHRKKIKQLEQEIRKNKELLYSQLAQPEINVNSKDSLIVVLGNLQKGIEITHFEHFQELKKICTTPAQLDDYKLLTLELGKLFSKKNKGRHHEHPARN